VPGCTAASTTALTSGSGSPLRCTGSGPVVLRAVGRAVVALQPAEVRFDLPPGPAGGPGRGPRVVVAARPADVQHPVEDRAATEAAAARLVEHAAARVLLRHGREVPVDLAREQRRRPEGVVDLGPPVRRACL